MSDDIVKQLSYFVVNEVRMPAGLTVSVIDEIERLWAEVERLRRWKAEAVEVILRWDRLADDVHCPLGRVRSDAVADEIERLRAAGNALAVAYRTLGGLDVAFDAALVAWEARK